LLDHCQTPPITPIDERSVSIVGRRMPLVSAPRILFLDDEPLRAAHFQADYPGAVWVRTAEDCLARLAEPWDEVHLDHDLNGETFVDHERDDCGMAVVRWLCQEPRPHLQATRFIVHTRNLDAACVMLLHLHVMGFAVQARPFGAAPTNPSSSDRPRSLGALVDRLVRWVRGGSSPKALIRNRPDAEGERSRDGRSCSRSARACRS
jgi:hypothetical protein